VTKQSQAPQAQSGKKSAKPPTTSGRATEAVSIAYVPAGDLDLIVAPSLPGWVGYLGDSRLPVIQRQALAEQIGNTQGNGHLRRAAGKSWHHQQLTQGLVLSDALANLQRDIGDAQPSAVPSAPAGGDAAPAALGPASEAEQRYDITLQVAPGPEESFTGVARTEILHILRAFFNQIHNRVEAGYDSHTYLKSVRDDQWIVGAISDFFADPLAGGIEMPPLWMWSEPRIMLDAALGTLNAGLVEPTARNLQRAADAWRRCDRRLYEYREGTISGAERTVTGLRVTAAAGAVAATMATGGAATAAGAGFWGTAAATGLGAGTYGFVQEETGQAAEIYHDLRENFDWGAIVRRGATDAINGFVGAIAGGALTRVFQRSFGSFLTNISDDVLLEMGLSRDAFLTRAQQFIAEFLGGIGSSPLSTAVTAVINAVGGGNPPRSAQEFVDLVVQDMVQGGAIQLFLGGLMHFYGRAGGSTHPDGGESPTSPRATLVEEGSGASRPAPRAETSAPLAASVGETPTATLPFPTVETPIGQHLAGEGTPTTGQLIESTSPGHPGRDRGGSDGDQISIPDYEQPGIEPGSENDLTRQSDILDIFVESQEQYGQEQRDVSDDLEFGAAELDEPFRIPELDSGYDPNWAPEGRHRFPAISEGEWVDGAIGDGRWEPHNPGRFGLDRGQSIPFREGVPDFTEYTVETPTGHPGTFEVEGLTGDSTSDYAAAVEQLAAQEGMTIQECQRWLRENRLHLHHYGGREMQIVPARLHGALAHQGSATEMRQ